ncbi:uncharacterized protein TNCV_3166601 [Trichonephila clavipes]|uniref:Uncharacterized protein n=1 Tax=Trichonephila clavipes TaxID=2585209 RepID=A0A8X6RE02_TRICX|nr:uncharacterized protein TNCV_3166601 [Trichonephila clavipes]
MGVCKCIVTVRYGGSLNSRRAASLLVRLMEGDERWEGPGHHQGFLLLNWGGTEQNRTVTCMVLKAKANDMRVQSEVIPPMFKSPSKLGTHLTTHCSKDERLSRPCPANNSYQEVLAQHRNRTKTCGVKARYATTQPPRSRKIIEKF